MGAKRFLVGLLGAVVALGCAHAPKPKEPSEDRQPVYVDQLKAPTTAASGQAVEVTVTGNLPSPAWELGDVSVERSGKTVTLTVWGVLKHKGMAAQVLVPFTKTLALQDLTPGTWTIEVRGHAGTSSKAQVEVK